MEGNKQIPYSFINEEDVLKRVNGNITLFNKLFAKFITAYRFSAADIRQLIEEKNYVDARLLVHTIKGTAANLGITAMWQAAVALEKSIVTENEPPIKESLSKFSAVLDAIVQEVSES